MLPNHANAFISRKKLSGYILSPTHPVGRFKARFFAAHGLTQENAEELESQLRQIAARGDLIETLKTPYGTKYIVDGSINTPTGRLLAIRTVWIIANSADAPTFVTAYPK